MIIKVGRHGGGPEILKQLVSQLEFCGTLALKFREKSSERSKKLLINTDTSHTSLRGCSKVEETATFFPHHDERSAAGDALTTGRNPSLRARHRW